MPVLVLVAGAAAPRPFGLDHAAALGGWFHNRSRAGGWHVLDNTSALSQLQSCLAWV